MSFGSSAMPKAQPQTPVPQQDDPQSFEYKRRAAAEAQGREGDSAHLLASSGTSTDTEDTKRLKPATIS